MFRDILVLYKRGVQDHAIYTVLLITIETRDRTQNTLFSRENVGTYI